MKSKKLEGKKKKFKKQNDVKNNNVKTRIRKIEKLDVRKKKKIAQLIGTCCCFKREKLKIK